MTAAQHRLQLAAIRVHEAALSSERVAQQRMKQTDAKWKVASCIEVDLNVRAGANLVIDFSQSRKACLAEILDRFDRGRCLSVRLTTLPR